MPVGGGSSSGCLLDLIARIDAASARLYAADAQRLAVVSACARREAAVLSARLDTQPAGGRDRAGGRRRRLVSQRRRCRHRARLVGAQR